SRRPEGERHQVAGVHHGTDEGSGPGRQWTRRSCDQTHSESDRGPGETRLGVNSSSCPGKNPRPVRKGDGKALRLGRAYEITKDRTTARTDLPARGRAPW